MSMPTPTDLTRIWLNLKEEWLWESPSQSTRHCRHWGSCGLSTVMSISTPVQMHYCKCSTLLKGSEPERSNPLLHKTSFYSSISILVGSTTFPSCGRIIEHTISASGHSLNISHRNSVFDWCQSRLTSASHVMFLIAWKLWEDGGRTRVTRNWECLWQC